MIAILFVSDSCLLFFFNGVENRDVSLRLHDVAVYCGTCEFLKPSVRIGDFYSNVIIIKKKFRIFAKILKFLLEVFYFFFLSFPILVFGQFCLVC